MSASLRGPFFNYYLGEIHITIYMCRSIDIGCHPVYQKSLIQLFLTIRYIRRKFRNNNYGKSIDPDN